MAGTRGQNTRRGSLAQGIAVQLALAMLSSGKAKSKAEAAQLANIDPSALRPSALKAFAQNNPIGREISQSRGNPDLLTITANVAGKRVSAREALSSGVESAIAILSRLGPRLAKLTKAEVARFQNAKRWLELSRSCGLFAPIAHAPIPAELHNPVAESEPEPESVPGSLAEFMEGDDLPPEGEPVAGVCKVEA